MSVDNQDEAGALEWLAASDALAMTEATGKDLVQAQQLLAELLKEGRLRAHVDRLWATDEADPNDSWKNRHEVEAEENIIVSTTLWRDSRFWQADRDLWRWSKNRFLITESLDPVDRTILEGVKICVADLEVCLGIKRSELTQPLKVVTPRKLHEWDRFWMAVVDLAMKGDLAPGRWANQDELIEELLELVGRHPKTAKFLLGPDSIRPRVSGIWKQHIDRR